MASLLCSPVRGGTELLQLVQSGLDFAAGFDLWVGRFFAQFARKVEAAMDEDMVAFEHDWRSTLCGLEDIHVWRTCSGKLRPATAPKKIQCEGSS